MDLRCENGSTWKEYMSETLAKLAEFRAWPKVDHLSPGTIGPIEVADVALLPLVLLPLVLLLLLLLLLLLFGLLPSSAAVVALPPSAPLP